MSVETFTYNSQELNVVMLNGTPWFIAADVCRILEIGNPSQALARLDEDEKSSLISNEGNRGNPARLIVSEPGLYSLILGSRKPEAKTFKRWVTHEVLPAIRRRGGYLTPEAAEQALTDPDFIIRLATELKAERAARAELEQQRRVLVPKADAFDLWLSSNADYGVDQAAKALCAAGYMTGRTRLFRTLSELGWAFKARDGWRYTQEHGPEGTKRLTVRMSYYLDSRTGESHGRTTLRVTAKGVHDLATRLGVNPATVADTLTAEEVAS